MLIIDSMTLNTSFCKFGSSKILALLFKWNSKQFCIPESHFNTCKLVENKKKWLKQEHKRSHFLLWCTWLFQEQMPILENR